MLHSLDATVGRLASTVRKGFKWADLNHGEEIELCVCTKIGEARQVPCQHPRDFGGMEHEYDVRSTPETHDVQGRGTVEGLWFGYFKDIPARVLQFEHEERSREYSGLLASMRHAYGPGFSESDPVTVVVYRRIS